MTIDKFMKPVFGAWGVVPFVPGSSLHKKVRAHAYMLQVGGVSSRCGIEQIHESLHPKRTIPSKGEVRPFTIIIIIIIGRFSLKTSSALSQISRKKALFRMRKN